MNRNVEMKVRKHKWEEANQHPDPGSSVGISTQPLRKGLDGRKGNNKRHPFQGNTPFIHHQQIDIKTITL
jgi:hypothetical protein